MLGKLIKLFDLFKSCSSYSNYEMRFLLAFTRINIIKTLNNNLN